MVHSNCRRFCSGVWVRYVSLPVFCILTTSMGHSSGARLSALLTRLRPRPENKHDSEQQELIWLGITCSMAEHVFIWWVGDEQNRMCMWIWIDFFSESISMNISYRFGYLCQPWKPRQTAVPLPCPDCCPSARRATTSPTGFHHYPSLSELLGSH